MQRSPLFRRDRQLLVKADKLPARRQAIASGAGMRPRLFRIEVIRAD
ncbi:hypothetical protein RSPO_m01097 (plasmid) [Ralstonia solanacearum Po82]|uniref:Uncharacterized protein n=1 Tax=Ralstonia solanacearum (strain Po82) TaxID=1031711 RepID=F6G9E5_RALS8|nr:hypothetical protein RSPO_m01097 [Ralstonia solanacearum Po82]